MPRFSSLSAAAMVILPGLIPGIAGPHAAPGPPPAPAAPAWHLALTTHFGGPGNASGYATILMAGREVWAGGAGSASWMSAMILSSRGLSSPSFLVGIAPGLPSLLD